MTKFIPNRSISIVKILGIALLSFIFCATAEATPTVRFTSGTTTVVLSDDFLSGLTLLGATVKPVAPATLDTSTKTATFPATAGILDLEDAKGELTHQGGLRFFTSDTRIHLLNFIIDTSGSSPVLTGEVVINSKYNGRVPLFDLKLPATVSLPLDLSGDTLEINNVAMTLSATAASTLNTLLRTNQLTQNFPVGTAKVSVKGRKLAVPGAPAT